MQAISSNLPSILQLNQFSMQVNSPSITPVAGDISQDLLNDIAELSSASAGATNTFENTMDNLASYKDIISGAKDSISAMRSQGQELQDIIAQAQQEGVSQELLDRLQTEVNEKIHDINLIKDAVESEDDSPFNGFSFSIDDMENLTGVTGENNIMNMMSSGMNSYSMDLSFEVDGISFDGSANIQMGMDSNGRFQFAFDVSLNYDLSGLTSEGGGITSPDAQGIVDNFMKMLDSQDGILAKANSVIDTAFEKIFDKMNAPHTSVAGYGDYTGSAMNSSSIISQQLVQKSSSVLDSIMFNQMPNIALNLL